MRACFHGRKVRTVAGAGALCFVALNGLAYRQALAMTNSTPGGVHTPRPKALSLAQKMGVLASGVRLPRPENNHTPLDQEMTYEIWTIPVENGISLEAWHVLRVESRGVILMFHGYADRKSSILPEARAFFDQGWDPVLVDLRGQVRLCNLFRVFSHSFLSGNGDMMKCIATDVTFR